MDVDNNGGKKVKYTCRICLDKEAIYQCPRCLIRTCSTKCVNAHKQSDRCDGIAKVVADKPIGQMGDQDLERDIRFLEDVGGSVERQARQDCILTAERFGVVVPRGLMP